MKRILIIGANGMLGYGVSKTIDTNSFTVNYTTRNGDNNTIKFDAINDNIDTLPKDYDYYINCIGIIKPNMKKSITNAIKVNSIFPHLLSEYCNVNNIKLIHISTDCVYSGNKGKYDEDSLHDCLDDYGKTKSLGECHETSMVIRTSIVGEEKNHFLSLISWVKSMKHKEVNGFNNHIWNGITTNYFGIICNKIIHNNLYEKGLFHIFSPVDVNKFQMLEFFNKKWNLNLKINEITTQETVDRTIRSNKELNKILNLPSFEEMINEL